MEEMYFNEEFEGSTFNLHQHVEGHHADMQAILATQNAIQLMKYPTLVQQLRQLLRQRSQFLRQLNVAQIEWRQ